MKAEELADGALVVSHDGSPLTKFMLGVMTVVLETARFVVSGVGFTATSKRAQFKGLVIVRVRDGKIVEGWNSFDQRGMLQQLGVVTLPGS